MNYWEYIKVEELLALQGGFDGDEAKVSNDESLFIVVHQIYELWFKIAIKELGAARDVFRQNPVPDVDLAAAVRALRRVAVVFDQAANHFKLIETLTTRDYLEFRDRLIPASGFQSAQLREIEILLGLEDKARVPLGVGSTYKDALKSADGGPSPATLRVERRLADVPSLRDAVYQWLSRTPIDGSSSEEAVDRFVARFLDAHRAETVRRIELHTGGGTTKAPALAAEDAARLRADYDAEVGKAAAFLQGEDDPAIEPDQRAFRKRVRAAIVFLESYRELPRLAWPREVVDALVAMEQAILVWRQRHARMVEREIGRRVGTGGSAGVDYLDKTALAYRVFSDIWGVRAILLRKPALPPLEHPDLYRFRVED